MATNAPVSSQRSIPGEPAWDIARLYPDQGAWSEDDYLSLETRRLVELSDGCVEVLPMPTELHQLIVAYLYEMLVAFVRQHDLGKVLFAPVRVRLWPGKFREPDVVFMSKANAARRHNSYSQGADLVVEVLSDENRGHDLQTKREEYARAGIPEYWIVDPQEKAITVLKLVGADYEPHGQFAVEHHASSSLLAGFDVDVQTVFSQR